MTRTTFFFVLFWLGDIQVAMATAAKAKLLLRELKSVKADLAFAKARCAQLEEENKVLRDREGSDKGQNREDDDLVLISLIFLYFNFVFIHLEHSH